MSNLTRKEIIPAGAQTDVVQSDLRISHQEVTNIKITRDGEYTASPGYLNVKTGLSIKSAAEFTHDGSGDRFILYQDGVTLWRIDYDSGDGNGYENEIPSTLTLTLPTGITIAADAKLRFFYYNGVIRITGASEPMWYGHIDRTIMKGAWEGNGSAILDLPGADSFETGLNSYLETNVNNSQVAAVPTLRFAPHGDYVLKVEQTSWSGYARKVYNVTPNVLCRIGICTARVTGQTGNLVVKAGSEAGSDALGSVSVSGNNKWIFSEFEFTPDSTEVYISLMPADDSSTGTAYFDYIYLEQKAEIVLDGWYLEPAGLSNDDISGFSYQMTAITPMASPELYAYYMAGFLQYDEAQFGLKQDIGPSGVTDERESLFMGINVFQYAITYGGAGSKTAFPNNRLTAVNSAFGSVIQTNAEGINPEDMTFYKDMGWDITEDKDDMTYISYNWWYSAEEGEKNRLYMVEDEAEIDRDFGDGFLFPGLRITLKNKDHGTTVDTIITNTGIGGCLPIHIEGFYIEIGASIYEVDGGGLAIAEGAQRIGNSAGLAITVERKIWYQSYLGYIFLMGGARDLLLESYEKYSNIPAGTEENTPNYSFYGVANKKAFILSQEEDEQDTARFSVQEQYDNFPDLNTIQTEVGDADNNLALIPRHGRITILKRRSMSQIQAAGTSYFEDIGLSKRGIYSIDGFIVIDNILYFIDSDDLYQFTGNTPEPIMGRSKLRNYYKLYVTSSSFLAYNKADQEIWIHLSGGKCLAYQMERQSWYMRNLDITPLGAFLSSDDELFFYSSTKFVNVNHSETTWNESMGFYIKSRLEIISAMTDWKKLTYFALTAIGNTSVKITVTDPELEAGGQAKRTITSAINADAAAPVKFRPNLMFKGLEVEIESSADNYINNTRLWRSVLNMEIFDDGK